MAEKWTGKLVLKMHNNRIKQKDIAAKLGRTNSYVSNVINGYPVDEDVKNRFISAVDELIAEKKVKE